MENEDKLIGYELIYVNNNNSINILIYPDNDKKTISNKNLRTVKKRVDLFLDRLPKAIKEEIELINQLRFDYGEDTKVTSKEVLETLKLINLKIYWDWTCESYTYSSKVHGNCDLVIECDRNMKITNVWFDG